MGMDALRLAPLLVFIVIGGQLTLIDLRSHRLPNRLIAICTIGILTLQITYSLAIGTFNDLSQTGLSVGKIFTAYVLLYLISRGQLGMGDVKFAIPVSLIVGWFQPNAWLISLLVTFLLAGIVSLIGILSRKLDRKSDIPFGPLMYVGSILTLILGL